MAENPEDWSREFKELGAARVRSNLATGHWEREKRAAARLWVETADAKAWQGARGDNPKESRSFVLRVRAAKWWRYAAPFVMGLVALGFMLRRMR